MPATVRERFAPRGVSLTPTECLFVLCLSQPYSFTVSAYYNVLYPIWVPKAQGPGLDKVTVAFYLPVAEHAHCMQLFPTPSSTVSTFTHALTDGGDICSPD